jgi:hypothetical protein
MKQSLLIDSDKTSPLQRTTRYALYTIVLAAITLGLLFIYWLAENPEVIYTKNIPMAVRPPTIAPAETEYVKVNFCTTNSTSSELAIKLVGRRSIIELAYRENIVADGCVSKELSIPIPDYADDDVYYFEFTLTTPINPLKEQSIILRSQEFTIQQHR